MGIRFTCPSGHKLHVKAFLAGKRGVCPHCGAKFVIPTTQQADESSASTSQAHDSRQHSSAEAFTASASIIIGVVDSPSAVASPADGDSSLGRSADSAGSSATPATAEPLTLPLPPTIGAATGPVGSPAARHVSRRALHRRKQVNMAIALLAAVILLALVLIWVLQRGADQPSADQVQPDRVANSWPSAATLHTRQS